METMQPSTRCLLSLFVWLAAVALTADAAFVFDFPYTDAVPDMREQLEQCSAVSQFSFRKNTQPTAAQVARMYKATSCSALANKYAEAANAKEASLAAVEAYRLFAVPMLDYCWYYRLPNTPCPDDPYRSFVTQFKDKVETCARATNVSYLEPNASAFKAAAYAYISVVLPALTKNKSSISTCPAVCTELSLRVRFLYERMTCGLGTVNHGEQSTFLAGSTAMYIACSPNIMANRLFYAFQPDWALPPLPESMDTPSPRPSAAPAPAPVSTSPPSSSDGTKSDGDAAPGTGTVASDHDDAGENAGDKPLPGSTKTPRPSVATIESNGTAADSRPSASQGPQGLLAAPTTKPLSSSTEDDPKKPRRPAQDSEPTLVSSSPIAVRNAVSSSPRYGIFVIISAAVVVGVLAVFLFVSRQRQRGTNEEIHDDDATTSDGDHYQGYYKPVSPGSQMSTDQQPSSSMWDGTGVSLQKTFPTETIKDIQLVGTGGSGVVFLVQDTRTKRLLASKRLAKNQLSTDKISAFYDEIQLVSKLDHPCIVSYIGATWTNRSDLQALFEYMDGGDLRTHLDSTPVEPWSNEKLEIAINIADALVYVHVTLATPIVHRDLKSRNILLTRTPQLRAKLSDFGVARHQSQHESMTTGVGTSRWLAPEVIVGGGTYDAACDIYSFGVVLSELDTHHVPFADCCDDGPLPEITILGMVGLDGLKPTFSKLCPPELLLLAQRCLSFDPRERPTAETVASELRRIRDAFA